MQAISVPYRRGDGCYGVDKDKGGDGGDEEDAGAQGHCSGYDHVIVDIPPADTAIIRSAVIAVDLVLVPASPTGFDLNRLMPTIELQAELEPVHPVEAGVLLTKVRRGTLSARGVRDVLADVGLPVLDTETLLPEMYAGSFGLAPVDLGRHDDLIKELEL
jgi:hypothetical protein